MYRKNVISERQRGTNVMRRFHVLVILAFQNERRSVLNKLLNYSTRTEEKKLSK